MDLVYRNSTKTRTFGEAFFRSYIKKTLAAARIKEEVALSVNLVGAAKMRTLNRKYRNKNTPTDVLSFPLGETALKGYTIRTLGDIFICPNYAERKAREEHISLGEKMAWLIVHGTLHLLDFDHDRSDEESAAMERMERTILKH